MEMIESFLIGVVSGIASSFFVTQIYRQMDKKNDRLQYISDVLIFANDFSDALFCVGTVEIRDEYIQNLHKFVIENALPYKKKWLKLGTEEKQACENFIKFYHDTLIKIEKCNLDMQRVQNGEKQYENEVESLKLEISNLKHMESMMHKANFLELRRKYAE